MPRLNKFIAESGLCSRREADALIAAGRVRLNGRTAEMGAQVGPDDVVEVDGRPVRPTAPEAAVYLAYHKPVGVVCVTDERVPGNIVAAVGHPRRIFPVGRLDKDSEGLIFLTSDGDVVNKILRAGNAHEKAYEVWVDRHIDARFVRRMARGVPVLGTTTLPCRVTQTGPARFDIVLTQGLNRQIRRMCEYLGYQVTRLRRVRIMNVHLGALPSGRWRDLTAEELAELWRRVADSSKTEEASRLPGAGEAELD